MAAAEPSARGRRPAPLWRWGEPLEPLAERIARGGVLAIPTESSYGLAVDPGNPAAVARVYGVKGREAGKPLPVVVAGVEQLASLGIDPEDPETAAALAVLTRFWPAPLTAVLPLTLPGRGRSRPAPAAPRWRCGCRRTRGCAVCSPRSARR